MRKLGLFAFLSMMMASTASFAATVDLGAGTPIVVRLVETLSTEIHKTGDDVSAVVAADVIVDNKVVVQAGAAVIATIAHAKKAGAIGAGGNLNIQITGVYAVDGTVVPVVGTKAVAGDDETTGTVVVGVVLCPLALLNEGDKAEIAANSQIRAMTIGTVKIQPKS